MNNTINRLTELETMREQLVKNMGDISEQIGEALFIGNQKLVSDLSSEKQKVDAELAGVLQALEVGKKRHQEQLAIAKIQQRCDDNRALEQACNSFENSCANIEKGAQSMQRLIDKMLSDIATINGLTERQNHIRSRDVVMSAIANLCQELRLAPKDLADIEARMANGKMCNIAIEYNHLFHRVRLPEGAAA